MNIFTLNQRYNTLVTSLDRVVLLLKSSSPQTIINSIIISNNIATIDLQNKSCHSFRINLTSELTNIIFINPMVNGNYIIYIYGSNKIIKKHLGSNIMTNLKGDTMVNGVFIVSVNFDGINYFLNFTNYTN